MKRVIRSPGALVLSAAVAAVWAGVIQAAPVEADPNQSYAVTPANGPWLICVTSYSGPMAEKFAHDLVLELRGRPSYKIPAFIFNRGKEERDKQQQELEQRRQQQRTFYEQLGVKPDIPVRLRSVRIEDQFAVLVGGYKDIEAARKALDAVKKLPAPETVPLDSVGIVGQPEGEKDPAGVAVQRANMNPFRTSFVVHNPTVPQERPDNSEEFLKSLKWLNSGESYSLLKADKPWSLAVKEFYGQRMLQPKSAPSGLMGNLFGNKSSLDAGALQAHEAARVLRKMQIEAYVLHTPHGSIVAVGNYDSPNDPRLLQNQKLLANFQLVPQNQALQFFAQPLPMQVPRGK